MDPHAGKGAADPSGMIVRRPHAEARLRRRLPSWRGHPTDGGLLQVKAELRSGEESLDVLQKARRGRCHFGYGGEDDPRAQRAQREFHHGGHLGEQLRRHVARAVGEKLEPGLRLVDRQHPEAWTPERGAHETGLMLIHATAAQQENGPVTLSLLEDPERLLRVDITDDSGVRAGSGEHEHGQGLLTPRSRSEDEHGHRSTGTRERERARLSRSTFPFRWLHSRSQDGHARRVPLPISVNLVNHEVGQHVHGSDNARGGHGTASGHTRNAPAMR